jgi:hypothetical protein
MALGVLCQNREAAGRPTAGHYAGRFRSIPLHRAAKIGSKTKIPPLPGRLIRWIDITMTRHWPT